MVPRWLAMQEPTNSVKHKTKIPHLVRALKVKLWASVRIKGQIVKMAVFADSMIHARLILEYQFGMNSLATAPVQVNEAGTIKPQTPDQARLAALKRQKDNVAKQIEAERDRQKIHRAQQQISQAIKPKSSSVA